MTILASALVSAAQQQALDETGIRWDSPEWLNWLSDGEVEVINLKPSAYTLQSVIAMVAGTKQSIPASGIQFTDYVRSRGMDGTTYGRVATLTSHALIDRWNPDWHNATQAIAPEHFLFDPTRPTQFMVYPPAKVGAQAEIAYVATPARIAALGQVINLADSYGPMLIDYMLFRIYGQDDEAVANAERSMYRRKLFENGVLGRAASETTAAPKA